MITQRLFGDESVCRVSLCQHDDVAEGEQTRTETLHLIPRARNANDNPEQYSHIWSQHDNYSKHHYSTLGTPLSCQVSGCL